MSSASRSSPDVQPHFETLEPRLLLDAIIKGPYLQQFTPESMVVMWETDTATASQVDYGVGQLDQTVTDPDLVTIHEMEITGLDPDTTYNYTVTSDGVTSDPSTFATAPATERSFRFVAYGDTRRDFDNPTGHADVIQGIINTPLSPLGYDTEFVIHTGDLINDGNNYNQWESEFFTPAHDLMVDTPMLPIIGNHEASGLLFQDFFSLPNNEQWFAYTYSNVRFIGLNTHNALYSPGSAQYDWLEAELQSSEYTGADWQIVYFHHPPYTATENHADDANVKQYLVPLFEANGVDMVFNGHSHAYERYLNNDVTYIVTGGGGAPLRAVVEDTQDPIRIYGESVLHHCVIDVDVAGKSLTLSARYNNGVEFDTVTLYEPVDLTPPTAGLTVPLDGGPDDLDPADDAVTVNTTQSGFQIQLGDVGDGVDDATVISATLTLTKDGGSVGYSFDYDGGIDVITLTPTGGDFGDGVYEIILSAGAARIADLADPPNEMVATTLTIEIDTSIVPPETLTFQQDVDGYDEMADTMIRFSHPDDNFADSATQYDQPAYQYLINADTDSLGGPSHVLLRFDGIIGTGPGQIDPGSTVVSATLRLRSTDDGNGGDLHPVLLGWVDTDVTWNNSFGGDGVQADDVEAALLADDGITQNNPDTDVDFDVAATLQAWADGTANDGWAVLPGGTNGWHIATAEHPTLDWRPELIVTFLPLAPNDPPVAVDDSDTTNEDTAVTVAVLANDTDPDGDALSVESVTQGVNGSVVNNGSTVTYTPDADFNGADTFTYTVGDGQGGTDTATVSVTVTAVNDPPVANDQSAATDEDTPVAITLTGSDVDEDSLTYAVTTPPVSGTLTGTAPNLTYTPDPNFNGDDSFTFTVDDGNGGTDTAIVSIAVNPVNDAPVVASAIADVVVDEDAADTLLDLSAVFGDVDVGDSLTLSVTGNTNPALVTADPSGTGLTLSYAADANGSSQVTVRATDLSGAWVEDAFTVTVNPVNDTPVAADDGYNVDEDSALIVAAPGLLSNDTDADGDPLSAVLVSDVSNGSLTLNANGSFDYTPNPDYVGSDSFTYKANDTHGDSNVATVTITVNAVNDSPVAADDVYTAEEDVLLSVPALGVLANDSDAENDPLTAVLISDVDHGSLTLNPDGSFDYTPAPDYFGSDSFTYKANDGELDSDVATVSITVNSINDAPLAADDAYQVDQDNTLTIDAATGVLANDTDIEDDPLSAILVSDASNGSLTLNPDGSFDYTPNAGYAGADSFTYTATDGLDDSNVATVSITVSAGEQIFYATGESTASGTVIGDYLDTHASDDTSEALTEILVRQKSLLEHTWTFDLTGGDTLTFHVEAWHDGTEDHFKFQYSTDEAVWTDMLTVTKTGDDNVAQTYNLPAGLSGTLYVRVIDTVSRANERSLDTLFVDEMYIAATSGGPQLPTVTVQATDAIAAEEALDTGTFTITRIGTSGDLTVYYALTGTADVDIDYTALSGSVTILDGAISADVTITPIDDADEEGTQTVILTIIDDAAYRVGSPDGDTVSLLDNDLAAVDDYAQSESTTLGTATSGDYASTLESDNEYEVLTEILQRKKSVLDHTWTFDVTGGSTVTFNVEAYHDGTEDDFTFQYSTDGEIWTDMLTITKTSDDDALQTVALPDGLSGTLYVRVIDTNRVNKEITLSTLYVDQMFIHCE